METKTEKDQTALYQLEKQKGVIRDRVRDVASHRHTSTYIFGPAGTGKSYLVRQTLDEIGADYYLHSGHLTPMGFFDMLRQHPDGVLFLDDVGSLFRDKIGQQLLLAALGNSYGDDWTRIIRYQRRGKNEEVNFSGGLIALSNLRLHDNDEAMLAIKSRTKPLQWDPSETQLAAVMRDAIKSGWSRDSIELTAEECLVVVDFLVDTCRHYSSRLDLRLLFDGALPDFAASKAGEHEVDWRDHAIMAIREQVNHMRFTTTPKTRAELVELERKIAERIRATCNNRREQVEAWVRETGKSERAFDRRSADLRIAK